MYYDLMVNIPILHSKDAVDCATEALEKYNVEKDIAAFIKKEMDKK